MYNFFNHYELLQGSQNLERLFYYKKSALQMLDRIRNETSLKNFNIISLSKTKFRVILGPFNDMKSLKDSYNKATILNFENLEIIKNV